MLLYLEEAYTDQKRVISLLYINIIFVGYGLRSMVLYLKIFYEMCFHFPGIAEPPLQLLEVPDSHDLTFAREETPEFGFTDIDTFARILS